MEFIRKPINKFIQLETSGSIVLFAATLAALILANSGLSDSFLNFWQNKITISLPGFHISKPLLKWINDGLMAIFFFLIGLELKREIISGELNNIRSASLPFFAAVGGMIAPAVLFIILNRGNAGTEGWGIPMAADIAFTLGILKLLGDRVPSGLKIFLMAFAIIDDLGAIIVIALFYSSNIIWTNIVIGLSIVFVLFLLSKFNYYSKYLFVFAGTIVWILFLKSGIHSTIAGVLVALTIPLKRKTNSLLFYEKGKSILDNFVKECDTQTDKTVLTKKQLEAIDELEDLTERTAPPLQYHEHRLHGWVSYLIMPLFALANAGVVFNFSEGINLTLSMNIAISLIVGNFIGIFSLSYLSIKLRLAKLPENVSMKQLAAMAVLGGLGFTMSLFINSLAFTDTTLIVSAKTGILAGSLIAGTLGYLALKFTLQKK